MNEQYEIVGRSNGRTVGLTEKLPVDAIAWGEKVHMGKFSPIPQNGQGYAAGSNDYIPISEERALEVKRNLNVDKRINNQFSL